MVVRECLPVDEQHGEVHGVEVGDGLRAARQAPGDAHEPVPEVVDVPGDAPPPTDDQLPPALRLQRLQQVEPGGAKWRRKRKSLLIKNTT
eukprot:2637225-Pyramimonas_sp.AAC.1